MECSVLAMPMPKFTVPKPKTTSNLIHLPKAIITTLSLM